MAAHCYIAISTFTGHTSNKSVFGSIDAGFTTRVVGLLLKPEAALVRTRPMVDVEARGDARVWRTPKTSC